MKFITKALLGLGALGGGYGLYRAGRNALSYRPLEDFDVDGFVEPGFEPVREAFKDNFKYRAELGGAVCVYRDGRKVVDLWGGVRDRATMAPWEEDTMVVVYSTTKGLAAMTMALANSRGLIDYDEPVAAYWPEFAQNGKENITVRQLLAHQAGLFAFDEPVDKETVHDLDRLAEILARARPAWEPGTRQGYHAISLGFYEGELIRRIDPLGRSLGRFFLDEIAQPLGLDFHIRLPRSIPNSRLAKIESPNFMKLLWGFPIRLTLDSLSRRSNIYRALAINPGSAIVHDEGTIYSRDLEVPSGGGVGTAEAIAHAYGEFASGGNVLGLRQRTLDALAAPAIEPSTLVRPSRRGRFDRLRRPVRAHRLRLRYESNGHLAHRRSARHRIAGGSLLIGPDRVAAGPSHDGRRGRLTMCGRRKPQADQASDGRRIIRLNPFSNAFSFHLNWAILSSTARMTPRCIAKLRPAARRADLFGGD